MRTAFSRLLFGFFVGSMCSMPAMAAVGGIGPLVSPPILLTPVEYYCSPGFEPGRGGTCVAVPSRAEVELFVDQPIAGPYHRYRRHFHRRRALRERY